MGILKNPPGKEEYSPFPTKLEFIQSRRNENGECYHQLGFLLAGNFAYQKPQIYQNFDLIRNLRKRYCHTGKKQY